MNVKTWPVELVPITKLKPHPYWERFHRIKTNTITSIAEDVDVTGHSSANAICVDAENQVIDGYTSWKGYQSRGLEMVYVMTVDLSWAEQQRFVFARHRNRRHYDDGDLMYFLINHYSPVPRGRPALNGPSGPFAEENPEKEMKIGEIVALFHTCRTKVKHGIHLVQSDARDLVNEVLDNGRTINSAFNALKNAMKGENKATNKGLKLPKSIPISDDDLATYLEIVENSGDSLEVALMKLVLNQVHEYTELRDRTDDSIPLVILNPTNGGAIVHPSVLDLLSHSEHPESISFQELAAIGGDVVTPAGEPDIVNQSSGHDETTGTSLLQAVSAIPEDDLPYKYGLPSTPRSTHGLLFWPDSRKIIALRMLMQGEVIENIAPAVGRNSAGNLISKRSLEGMVRALGLPFKNQLTEADKQEYAAVIEKLKAQEPKESQS